MALAERFGEPDVDAFMERVSPEQFFEWSAFDAVREEERERAELSGSVQQRMQKRTGG